MRHRPLFIASFIFATWETHYFGWNLTPGSPEELICDGIALTLFALGFACMPKRESASQRPFWERVRDR